MPGGLATLRHLESAFCVLPLPWDRLPAGRHDSIFACSKLRLPTACYATVVRDDVRAETQEYQKKTEGE